MFNVFQQNVIIFFISIAYKCSVLESYFSLLLLSFWISFLFAAGIQKCNWFCISFFIVLHIIHNIQKVHKSCVELYEFSKSKHPCNQHPDEQSKHPMTWELSPKQWLLHIKIITMLTLFSTDWFYIFFIFRESYKKYSFISSFFFPCSTIFLWDPSMFSVATVCSVSFAVQTYIV